MLKKFAFIGILSDVVDESQRRAMMELYAALKQKRVELARSKSQPAFCVFSNKVLDAIVAKCPITVAELYAISGMGSQKVKEYGGAILDICRAFHAGSQPGRGATGTAKRGRAEDHENKDIVGTSFPSCH